MASAKLGTSTPTSRWLTVDFLCVVVELDRVLDRDDVVVEVLVDVVDHRWPAWCVLPEPVGPVTRNSPRGRMHQLGQHRRQCPAPRRSAACWGSAAAPWRRCRVCLKIETRKRAMSPKAKPKSEPPTSCSSCWQRSGVMLFISATVSSGSSTLVSSRTRWPSMPDHRRLADGDVQVAGALRRPRSAAVCRSEWWPSMPRSSSADAERMAATATDAAAVDRARPCRRSFRKRPIARGWPACAR